MGKLIKFSHINERGDFAAMLAHFDLTYTRKGDQLRLLCPFHEDNKPSLNITLTATGGAQTNTFHCFGCAESGSLIDFVAAMEGGSDLRAAAELIASVSGCGLAPPRAQKRAGKVKRRKIVKTTGSRADASEGADADADAPTATSDTKPTGDDEAPAAVNPPLRFAFTLEPDHPYLAERLDAETVRTFGLGYLPETSRSMMKGRICIPIHNAAGDLVAYAGRCPASEPPGDAPKYLLPKAFEKQAVLFNLNRVDPASQWVVVVEGFFGAMRLHRLGVPVVAVMGSSVNGAGKTGHWAPENPARSGCVRMPPACRGHSHFDLSDRSVFAA